MNPLRVPWIEHHPLIHRRLPLLAWFAGLDANRLGHSRDCIAGRNGLAQKGYPDLHRGMGVHILLGFWIENYRHAEILPLICFEVNRA